MLRIYLVPKLVLVYSGYMTEDMALVAKINNVNIGVWFAFKTGLKETPMRLVRVIVSRSRG